MPQSSKVWLLTTRWAWLQEAKVHLEKRNYEAAFVLYEEGLKLYVPDKELRFRLCTNRGLAAIGIGKPMQAIFDLTVAIGMRGERWRPLLLRSRAYEAVSDDLSAAKVLLVPASPCACAFVL